MKKIISVILIILLALNFIFFNTAYAEADGARTKMQNTYTGTNTVSVGNTAEADILESGETTQKQGDESNKVSTSIASYGTSILGAVTGVIARVINILVFQIDLVMAQLTYATETVEGTQQFVYWFTIERCVFNRIPLFNINYFNTYEDDGIYKVGDIEIVADTNNQKVKTSISGVYYVCRFIAMALGLLVLIYIGIRMAISTVASEQAKYKKMLVSWVESFVILFLMLYIMSFIINFGEALTNTFYKLEQQLIENNMNNGTTDYEIFEDAVRSQTLSYTFSLSGLKLTFWSIMYWCLLFMEIKFCWTYLKRFLMVGFLMIISPLVTITYSIDKAGDGKAQAFSVWMKEFIINVLIQPLHALIYLVFVFTANNIAEKSPLVAIAFLMSMGTVEKMVKQVFNIADISTMQGLGEMKVFRKGK